MYVVVSWQSSRFSRVPEEHFFLVKIKIPKISSRESSEASVRVAKELELRK